MFFCNYKNSLRRLYQFMFCSILPFLFLLLSGCGGDTWLGKPEPPPIPGQRIDILYRLSPSEIPDSPESIALLPPLQNSSWNLNGGNTRHNLGNPAFDSRLSILWKIKAGREGSTRRPFLIQPVADTNTVFMVDTRYRIVAINLIDGTIKWQRRMNVPAYDLDAFGGGMALIRQKQGLTLFICTGYGSIEAFEIVNGQQLWKQKLPQACNAPPIGNDKQIFVSLINNTLRSFESSSGRLLWNFIGTPQVTRIVGSPSPALDDDRLFYPISSGEIIAINPKNGQTLWGDFLIKKQTSSFLQALNDLRASPVVDDVAVYALASSGTAVAINKTSGKRLWKANISAISTPWVNGNAIFIQGDDVFVALNKNDGSLFWQTPLPKTDSFGRPYGEWLTPILAENVFFILNNNGSMIRINAKDGSLLKALSFKGNFDSPPIIVNKTIVLLSREGYVIALK